MTQRLDDLSRKLFVAMHEIYPNVLQCAKCGDRYSYGVVGINLAHIEKRGKKSLRWEPNNWLPLCSGTGTKSCHSWFDNNKVGPTEWLKENYPEKYLWLKEEVDGKPRSEQLFLEKVPQMLEREEQMKKRLAELQG